MTQTSILDLEKTTDRAIYIAGAFADPDWMREARACVSLLCKIGNDFTGDDVWALLDAREVRTGEPRALGSVIREFAKDKQIIATGQYRKSTRRSSHRRPLAVWRPVTYKRHLREVE